jgi:mediator of RNA polymerase II transcription subunit 17
LLIIYLLLLSFMGWMEQVAHQVIQWLHEEALVVGMKTIRDLLCLHMNLEQGDPISLLAHVDPDDPAACIWWELAMLPTATDDAVKFSFNQSDSETRVKSLGSPPLESLYAVLMDLANFCGNSTIC